MALIITNDYRARRPGHVLHFTCDDQVALCGHHSALSEISLAGVRLRKAQRQARVWRQAGHDFPSDLIEQMRAEARKSVHGAVWRLLCGAVALRAGYLC